MSNAFKKVIGV